MATEDRPLTLRIEDQALVHNARVVMEALELRGIFRATMEAIIVDRRGLEAHGDPEQPEQLTPYAELVLREFVGLKPFTRQRITPLERVMLARRAIRVMVLGGFGG